jgi:hypothetical protein
MATILKNHFVVHGKKAELFAIADPASAIGGNFPYAISGREWNDKSLRSRIREHREGDELAVPRGLSARLTGQCVSS